MLLHRTPIKLARFLRRKTFLFGQKVVIISKGILPTKAENETEAFSSGFLKHFFSHVNTTEIFE